MRLLNCQEDVRTFILWQEWSDYLSMGSKLVHSKAIQHHKSRNQNRESLRQYWWPQRHAQITTRSLGNCYIIWEELIRTMIKEQKTTSRNGVFFSVMRGGLLEGKKKTRKEILKMISSNSAATWFYRAREREREGCTRKMTWESPLLPLEKNQRWLKSGN